MSFHDNEGPGAAFRELQEESAAKKARENRQRRPVRSVQEQQNTGRQDAPDAPAPRRERVRVESGEELTNGVESDNDRRGSFAELPTPVVLYILSLLHDVEDLLSCAAVNVQLNYLCKNGTLWKDMCFRYYPSESRVKPNNYSWKGFFQRLWVHEQYYEKASLVRKKGRSHLAGVTSLSMHRNLVATGSFDHTIRLWDVKAGKGLKVFRGHSRGVLCVYLADDLLASGSADCTIRLWSTETKECTQVLSGHTDAVSALCGDAARKLLVSGGMDSLIKVWDLASGECMRTLRGHENAVKAVEIQLFRLISGGMDAKVIIWNVNSGEVLQHLNGHRDTVLCAKTRGELLVTGGRDNKAILWNMAKGKLLSEFKVSSAVLSVDMDKGRIILGTQMGSVVLINVYTRRESRIFDLHDNAVNGVALGNKMIASCSGDRTVGFTFLHRRANKDGTTVGVLPKLVTSKRGQGRRSQQPSQRERAGMAPRGPQVAPARQRRTDNRLSRPKHARSPRKLPAIVHEVHTPRHPDVNSHREHVHAARAENVGKWNPSPAVRVPRLFEAPPSYRGGPRSAYGSQAFDYDIHPRRRQRELYETQYPVKSGPQLRDQARSAYMETGTQASRWVLKRIR